jgi:hypothetical protein
MSGGALARSTFQSSIVPPPDSTATDTPVPTFTPDGSSIATVTPPILEVTPTETLVVEVAPTQPAVVEVTPTLSGFLPPPTLVNPAALAPGRQSPSLTENRPLVGPAALPEATPTQAAPAPPGAAELIDSGVVALSYLWLCCGALLLAAAGLTIVWLSRRSRRQ